MSARGGAVQGVYVPARICQLLESALPMAALRSRVRGNDREVDEVLRDIGLWASVVEGRADATDHATAARPALEWLTPGQAAARLGVAGDTVRRAIREQRLPAEKHDGHWRIRTTDLARYTRKAA